MTWRIALLTYGLLNSIAYSCLLPLWEGWDEGYHYGYVQYLSTHRRFPVLGETPLSREIWHAYELTPVSHYLQAYNKAPMNFTDHAVMPAEERDRLRRGLWAIPPGERLEPQMDKLDYEVNQSPLPYLFMAPIDWALSGRPLPVRVLCLRLVCSTLCVLLLANAVWLLSRELGLPEMYATAALFCVFSSQVLYAVFCHVCNDCFAVPVCSYLILATIRAWKGASTRVWAIAGTITAVAVLTKAYLLFVAVLPAVTLGLALWQRKASFRAAGAFVLPIALSAAPWYARNLVLYHNLTGTTDSTSNLSFSMVVNGALALPWRDGIAYMAHGSLWTGNNSFTTFSAATLNLMLAVLTVGAILYCIRAKPGIAERAIVSAVALHCCGLALITVAYFVSTRGGLIGTWPWYSQPLLAPVLLIVFLGISRFEPWGRMVLAACVALWGYVMLSTYFVKLAPQYGGFVGNAHIGTLWRWYLASGGQRDNLLATTCLVSPPVLWVALGAASVGGLLLCGMLLLRAVLYRPLGDLSL